VNGAGRCLSATDTAFLYLERKEIPLHIACVALFDSPLPFDEFVATLESKIHLIPRYTQIVEMPAYNLGYPVWKDDPHFDIRRHIFHVTLDPPGGEAELEALAGRILSQLMDRSKPLWDICLVDGLQDGRGAMIWRVHHCLADGISGVALMNVLFSPMPESSFALPKQRRRRRKSVHEEPSLVEAITKVVRSTVDGLIAAEAGIAGLAQGVMSNLGGGDLTGLLSVLPELAASVERLPFNKPCSGDRKFCWAEIDLAQVEAIREYAGGTVNDVVLTVLTRALARYLKLHRQSVGNRLVRIVCPVSLRRGEHNGVLGNQISFLPVALPLDVQDPVQMLRGVARRTDTMKRARAADLVALAAACIAAAPPPIQAMFWTLISQATLPLPLFNMICTNVPGPPIPLYSVGRRMLAIYPQVPTGYELGIGCAVQTYDRRLSFGLIADAHIAPDVKRLRDYLYVAFDELCRGAGVKTAARKPRARRETKTETAKAPEAVQPSPTAPEPAAHAPAPETPPQTALVVSDKHAA
jgi:diacylglycerol O-acyltransferase